MPSSRSHFSHAINNLDFLKSFFSEYKFNDWSITVSFYSSVHLVEYATAKFDSITFRNHKINLEHSNQLPQIAQRENIVCPAGFNKESHSQHQVRNLLLKGSDEFIEMSTYYDLLYKNSIKARYKQFRWDNNQVKLLINNALNPIISWVNKNFNQKIKKIKI